MTTIDTLLVDAPHALAGTDERDRATRPAASAARCGARPVLGQQQVLQRQLVRVRQVMDDFVEAAAELDREARVHELRGDLLAAAVDRAHAKQMRLCVARLHGALR